MQDFLLEEEGLKVFQCLYLCTRGWAGGAISWANLARLNVNITSITNIQIYQETTITKQDHCLLTTDPLNGHLLNSCDCTVFK